MSDAMGVLKPEMTLALFYVPLAFGAYWVGFRGAAAVAVKGGSTILAGTVLPSLAAVAFLALKQLTSAHGGSQGLAQWAPYALALLPGTAIGAWYLFA